MKTEKKTFVLVHGSWHGAWCWYKVVPRLHALGHRAIAIDLPGHGTDWKSPKEVTLQGYVDAVTAVMDRQPDPVVLVGHSRGGIVISQVAEERPAKIEALVYLAAFLIPNGESMLQTATTDAESRIVPNLIFDEAGGTHMLKREGFRDALYHDCSEEDVALASALLTPEPNAPVGTPLRLGSKFESVRRVYVECRQDRGISPAVQKKMQARVGVHKTHSIDASHSPFLSAPAEVVRVLLDQA